MWLSSVCYRTSDSLDLTLLNLWLFSPSFFSFSCVNNLQFLKMLKRAKSSFIIQNTCALIKDENIVQMCRKTFDNNLVIYQNESTLKKRWVRNLLMSTLIGFVGGFSIVLRHHFRYRIRWFTIYINHLFTLNRLFMTR